MDRVTKECARFLLSQLDLASCLDLRSMPGVAPELFASRDVDNEEDSLIEETKNYTAGNSSQIKFSSQSASVFDKL